jgi:hypothetical protein
MGSVLLPRAAAKKHSVLVLGIRLAKGQQSVFCEEDNESSIEHVMLLVSNLEQTRRASFLGLGASSGAKIE